MVDGQSVAAIAEKPRSAVVAAAGFPASADLTILEQCRGTPPVGAVRSVPDLCQARSGVTPRLRMLLKFCTVFPASSSSVKPKLSTPRSKHFSHLPLYRKIPCRPSYASLSTLVYALFLKLCVNLPDPLVLPLYTFSPYYTSTVRESRREDILVCLG